MTTSNHDPIPFGAPRSTAVLNAPLAQLDAAISSVIATGSGVATSLTAIASAGTASLTVASSTGFVIGDPIYIGTGATFEARIVATVPDATHITVTVNLTNTYAVGKPVTKSPVELVAARGTYTSLDGRVGAIEGRVFDVKRYGALGDGVTNDRAAIQAAVDAALAAGGGLVWLGFGNFACGSAVDVKAGVTVQGTGWGTTVTANGNWPAFTSTAAKVAVRDLRIVGSANAANTLNRGIQFTGTVDGLISGIRTEGCFRGIQLVSPCSEVVIEKCWVMSDKSDLGAIDIHGSEKCVVDKCYVVSATTHGIDIREAQASSYGNNKVTNCHVQAPGSAGIVLSGSSGTGITLPGCEIIGNTVISAGGLGIIVENGAQFSRVIGNHVRDSVGTGILVGKGTGDAPSGNIVANNTIRNAGDHGIHSFDANYTLIEGNRVSVFANDGIRVNGGSVLGKGTIHGNVVTDGSATTGRAIRIYGNADGTAVSSNTVTNTAGYGIRIEGSTGCALNGNTVTDADSTGVLAIGGISCDATAHRTLVVGNTSRRTSGTKQDYGVHIETGATKCLVMANMLYDNTTAAILDNGTSTIYAAGDNVTT